VNGPRGFQITQNICDNIHSRKSGIENRQLTVPPQCPSDTFHKTGNVLKILFGLRQIQSFTAHRADSFGLKYDAGHLKHSQASLSIKAFKTNHNAHTLHIPSMQ